MKGIKSVKLAMNKETKVVMVSEIEMGDESDIDSLFLCYFTILTPPLRLSVLTSGQLVQKLSKLMNVDEKNLINLLKTDPLEYSKYVQQYTNELISVADEQNRILLDSDENAKQARMLITSILDAGYYLQKTKFIFENGTVQEQEQKISIEGMKPTFKAMLDICKNWKEVVIEQ